ncbi:MAG: hypothetical protein D6691_06085 [Candidatus Hydrogenedentota bacterium]|nr:MAG: hypothetical protein D6691_06085 [Candidatus Hydrogenedentota bacterium]
MRLNLTLVLLLTLVWAVGGARTETSSKKAMKHRFVFYPKDNPTTVVLTGDHWGWNPAAVPMTRQSDGTFTVEVELEEGAYLYKFVADGKWYHDEKNPNRVSDGFGGFNSILVIGSGKSKLPLRRSTLLNLAASPVEFRVQGVPSDFKQGWIPVRFEEGQLVYDDREPTATHGRLLLSAEMLSLPQEKGTSHSLAPRQIFVYLPKGYFTPGSKHRYPVIYLHDGQNVWDDDRCCFGHGGWHLNTLLDSTTTLPQAILVGIPNSSARLAEYGLGADILRLRPSPYHRFLREVVKPRIDQDFRTRRDRKHTAVMGSSMGGIVSITTGYVYPDTFGVVAALSPAFQVPDAQGRTLLDVVKKHGRGRFRLYVDNGTAGETQDGAPLTREFVNLARQKGWKDGVDFEHFEDVGAAHNERAWRMRAWRPLKFILESRSR